MTANSETPEYLNTRAVTIYGGAAEIQRDILAKSMLGLMFISHLRNQRAVIDSS